ncbi:conserved hypothetical protein [Pirellula staleyi DSM 6068]|uniref:DUF2760 domain-containing protein n=1 Tax=Pirellula staleyi (strain ATCC 27377 / DSM 6068 / ICPB 4128) TaxID=530564 RepID=D2R0N0_PIRSD|nr:DUF2760 domain-containing protein [Pirellula staleyi]ADB16628.1 conserved hypothetical protein [Pirellula staleyi DSM 6068]
MGRISTAFAAFFKCLASGDTAGRVATALQGNMLPKVTEQGKTQQHSATSTPAPKPEPKTPLQSDAIALLATLQREARLVDLIQEPLSDYSDAQIGAAARGVLKDSAAVLDRLFSLQRIAAGEEGSTVSVPPGYDPGRYKVVGSLGATAALEGTLVHGGWEAKSTNLPTYTGSAAAAKVIAPAEVETK